MSGHKDILIETIGMLQAELRETKSILEWTRDTLASSEDDLAAARARIAELEGRTSGAREA